LVVSIDLAVNLPKTIDGFRHLMIMKCSYSGYIVAAPLKSRSGIDVLNAFRNTWLAVAGKPHLIQADNELALSKGVFLEFMNQHGITLTNSLAYSPAGNGISEAAVKITKGCLRSFCMANDVVAHWPKFIWLITKSLNSLVTKSSGTSPELLFFGTKSPEVSQDILSFSNNAGLTRDNIPAGVYRAALLSCLQMVDESRNLSRARNLEYRNSHKMPKKIEVEDIVALKVMSKAVAQGVPRSLNKIWRGPFIVTKVFTKLLEVQNLLHGNKQLCSVDHVKPWHLNTFEYYLPASWDQEIRKIIPEEQHPEMDTRTTKQTVENPSLPEAIITK
jgi:hypothetical protein